MKRFVGTVLLLAGLAVMVGGLAFALQGYVEMIQQAVNDPLAEQATTDEPERAQARDMLKWAIVGGAGAPVAAVGALLVFSAKRKKRRAKMLAR